jgi:hypothetical protein
MTDQQLALKAVSDAQRVLEEYLEPRPHNPEGLLDRLVEILERPDIIVAVDRAALGARSPAEAAALFPRISTARRRERFDGECRAICTSERNAPGK